MQLTDSVYWVGSGECGLSHYKDCHCYLVGSEGDFALIDTGCGIDTRELEANISRVTPLTSVRRIFLTHGHADHSGGAARLAAVTGAELYASAPEKKLVEEGDEWALGLTLAKRKGAYPQEYRYTTARVHHSVAHRDVFHIGQLALTALIVPGHSPAGVCYLLHSPSGTALFPGDTVFLHGYVSVINCPGCELSAYRENISTLHGLGVDALFPGHGTWTVRDGQKHLDTAIEHFSTSALPLMR
ncbi:MBL fold metallo-hydrolase [Desulfovibrio sp. OttesenSCG-928-I05]|nr:MBL fold metallo-hydrolase [Desulfovibrio sp. OttesenSCG-928-I05]